MAADPTPREWRVQQKFAPPSPPATKRLNSHPTSSPPALPPPIDPGRRRRVSLLPDTPPERNHFYRTAESRVSPPVAQHVDHRGKGERAPAGHTAEPRAAVTTQGRLWANHGHDRSNKSKMRCVVARRPSTRLFLHLAPPLRDRTDGRAVVLRPHVGGMGTARGRSTKPL